MNTNLTSYSNSIIRVFCTFIILQLTLPVSAQINTDIVKSSSTGSWGIIWGVCILSQIIVLIIAFFYWNKVRLANSTINSSNKKIHLELGKYETLFNSMQISVEYYGADGRIIDLNNKCIEMWGMVDKKKVIANGKYMFTQPFLTKEEIEQLKEGKSISFIRSYSFDYINEVGMFDTTKTGDAIMSVNISPIKDIMDDLDGYVVTTVDITEIDRCQKELEASKIKWETLYNEKDEIIRSMPIGVAIYDKYGREEALNKVLADIFGITDIEAHLKRHISIFEDPAIPEQIKDQIRKGEDSDITIEYDLKKVAESSYYDTIKEYITLTLNVKLRIVRNNKNQIISYIAIVQDITEQCNVVSDLKELRNNAEYSLSLLNNIIDKIPLSIFIKDANDDFRYVMINDNLAKLQRSTKNDIIGKTDCQLYNQDIANLYKAEDQKAIAADGVPVVNIKPFGADTDIIIESTEAAFTSVDNRQLVIGVIVDVTERENARMELQRTKEAMEEANMLLNNIIQQIPVGLYIKDIDNDFKYMMVNQKLAEIHNCTIDDFIGNTVHNIVAKEIVDIFTKDNEETIKKGGEAHVSIKQIEINGVMRTHEVTQMMLSALKGHRLIVGIVADITEKEQRSLELKQAKEHAEKSDYLKSAFLANMSHEIRTPLNAIVGFSELIKDATNQQEKEEYFKIISTNNELLLCLINDILDLSKVESGIMHFERTEFDMAKFFNDFSASMKLKSTNPNVEFISVNPYKSCILKLDKNRLAQVLTNFVSNAIKYTPKGYIKMGYEYIDQGLKIYVEDTGIGIAEEKRDRVFLRFEKLDDFAQGTGLGLSICKAIIDTYGGKIGYDSIEGKGSTFWSWTQVEAQIVHFSDSENSVLPSQIGAKLYAKPTAVNNNNIKILIAEDNDGNYLLLRSILKNYNIARVINGLQAVELLEKESFDIILMDINMPIMGGIEATKKIRQFNTEIKIIAVTANVFDTDIDNAINAGCNGFIPKPIKKEELLNMINKQI